MKCYETVCLFVSFLRASESQSRKSRKIWNMHLPQHVWDLQKKVGYGCVLCSLWWSGNAPSVNLNCASPRSRVGVTVNDLGIMRIAVLNAVLFLPAHLNGQKSKTWTTRSEWIGLDHLLGVVDHGASKSRNAGGDIQARKNPNSGTWWSDDCDADTQKKAWGAEDGPVKPYTELAEIFRASLEDKRQEMRKNTSSKCNCCKGNALCLWVVSAKKMAVSRWEPTLSRDHQPPPSPVIIQKGKTMSAFSKEAEPIWPSWLSFWRPAALPRSLAANHVAWSSSKSSLKKMTSKSVFSASGLKRSLWT